MTLIVEDGTGLSNSESYSTVDFTNKYHYDRGNTDWAALTVTIKEQYLRRATDYLVQKYRSILKGTRLLDTQALDYPRDGVYIDNSVLVSNSTVPIEWQRATAELALKSVDGELLEDAGGSLVTREKVDVIEVEYSENATSHDAVEYSSVEAMLKPYLETGANGSGLTSFVERG